MTTRVTDLAGERLLRRADVEAKTGLSRATIYRRMEANSFPRPVAIGPGCVRWKQSEVDAWLDELEKTPARAA